MKKIQQIILVMLFLTYASLSFAQEAQGAQKDGDLLEKISKDLQYGVDAVVKDAITTLIELDFTDYTSRVLERIEYSKSNDVIIEGLQYLRHFLLEDGVPFAKKILNDANNWSVRTIQYVFFYMKDIHEKLSEEDKSEILASIEKILITENIGMVLASLELLPLIYTELDIPYQKEIEENVLFKEDIVQYSDSILLQDEIQEAAEGTGDIVVPVQKFSSVLRSRYDAGTVQIIREKLIETLAKIQAYTSLDFILKVAKNDALSASLRIVALRSLAYYEMYPSETIKKEILDLLELLRSDTQTKIRQSVCSFVQNIKQTNFFADQVALKNWLLEGLRDSEEEVRQACIEAAAAQIDSNPALFDSLEFFVYIINDDPSKEVRKLALEKYVSLSSTDEGRVYLLQRLSEIQNLTTDNRTVLTLAFREKDRIDTISVLAKLIEKYKEKDISFLLRSIAELAAGYKDASLASLAETLITSKDSEVVYHALNIIAKNRLYELSGYVLGISRDKSKSAKTRLHARRIVELLRKR